MVPKTRKPLCQGTSAAVPRKINSDKLKKYCPPIDGGECKGYYRILDSPFQLW